MNIIETLDEDRRLMANYGHIIVEKDEMKIREYYKDINQLKLALEIASTHADGKTKNDLRKMTLEWQFRKEKLMELNPSILQDDSK